jgi:nucleoside-diphosphate-sugar epimerase
MRALVTGGAGFIGSHLATTLLERGDDVVVLDSLATGRRDNVPTGATFVEGSVADPESVARAVDGCDVVFHLGALGAVARSVADPLTSDTANVRGTLAVLTGARDAGVRRLVFASSSSVYGGAEVVPTPESAPLRPRSPYAVTKLTGEHYCRVFAELFELETVALRYFNVFGPRQRPDSVYAAVIPLFARALLDGTRPLVHGDGMQSRDFTYVSDVVAANLAAAVAASEACNGKVFNIAGGNQHTLLDLLRELATLIGVDPDPEFGPARAGDVRHSCADATAAANALGFACEVSFAEGLAHTLTWMRA